MTQELDMDVNNLCTTEEAFERFQAISIYEEDEFLSISSTLPSQTDIPSLTSIPNESLTNKVDFPDQPQTADCKSSALSEENTTHRKDSSEKLSCKLNNDLKNTVTKVDGQQTIQNAPKKRGRKKKTVDNSKPSTINQNSSASRIVKKSNDLSLENNSQEIQSQVSLPKKRGRKSKKINQEMLDENSKKQSLLESTVNSLEESPVVLKTPCSVEEKLEYKNSTELQTSGASTNTSFQTPVASVNNIKKAPGKRGRPRKKPLIENTVNNTEEETKSDNNDLNKTDKPEDDDADDVVLSKLKETLDIEVTNIESNSKINDSITENELLPEKKYVDESNDNVIPPKRNSKMPIMSDFEYNIDSVVGEPVGETENTKENHENEDESNYSLLVEDPSRRPTRRKARQPLHYDEDSEEDPFANVETSDDEPRKFKKGYKYYSDDEYIPGLKKGKRSLQISASASDSASDDKLKEVKKQKRRRYRKKSETGSKLSPRKRNRKKNVENAEELIHDSMTPNVDNQPDNNLEVCLQESSINIDDDANEQQSEQTWGSSHQFQNYLAKKIQGTALKIKKVSTTDTSDKLHITPLEIPVLNTNEAKKNIEMSVQTDDTPKATVSVQTTAPYAIPMKENVTLTPEQSASACEFLKSVVTTTAELGQLMTQKSEDFIKKKINTEHVTDTFKMDYCIEKSFLLLKLAKHNLIQMEDDLAKQYEEFLKCHGLLCYREKQKSISSIVQVASSDSDCEIVEEPVKKVKQNEKPKFNPKTVFLNKELSIKIAKKPEENKSKEKLNIKGRNTVWINDSVMVKKVKTQQSFLAQDSRNKKPPDYKRNLLVMKKIISDFFKDYESRRAKLICAPFTSTEWLSMNKSCICSYYFFVKSDFSTNDTSLPTNSKISTNNIVNNVVFNKNSNLICSQSNNQITKISSPKTLFSQCIEILKKKLYESEHITEACHEENNEGNILVKNNPETLLHLCTNSLAVFSHRKISNKHSSKDTTLKEMPLLKTLCYREIAKFIHIDEIRKINEKKNVSFIEDKYAKKNSNPFDSNTHTHFSQNMDIDTNMKRMKSLFCLCVEMIQNKLKENINSDIITKKQISYTPKSLKHIVYRNIKCLFYNDRSCNLNGTQVSKPILCQVRKLADMSFEMVSICFMDDTNNNSINKRKIPEEESIINSVNTMSEEAFSNIEEASIDNENNLQYLMDEENMYYDEDDCNSNYNNFEESDQIDNNWATKVQMKELTSCSVTVNSNENSLLTQIKIEPLEDNSDDILHSAIIKSEPAHNLDEMINIPETVITKQENIYNFQDGVVQLHTNRATVDDNTYFNENIFSQSALRIRKQYEPDSDDDIDTSMSLLVPQTFEPLNIESAKGSLMTSSTDDEDITFKKTTGRRKNDKRKVRNKKNNTGPNNKDTFAILKGKQVVNSEVEVLTKKMRDKIRQEEKKTAYLDSDNDSVPLKIKRSKDATEKCNNKQELTQSNQHTDADEVQCNNIDSTQLIDKTIVDNSTVNSKTSIKDTNFTGFNEIDLDKIQKSQKYVKNVYNKILPAMTVQSSVNEQNFLDTDNCLFDVDEKNCYTKSVAIDLKEPVEQIECEPTIPIFEDFTEKHIETSNKITKSNCEDDEKENLENDNYLERFGWKCYPINVDDKKLYHYALVKIEKLPESFVETYFAYQNVTDKSKEDAEVDRLTNLQSLNRVSNLNKKLLRNKYSSHEHNRSEQNAEANFHSSSPVNTEHFDELTPSEDEGGNIYDELLLPVQKDITENCLAKTSLMNDSDLEEPSNDIIPAVKKVKIKKEIDKNDAVFKSKLEEMENGENFMLTAEKMMNKELTMLRAPVDLNVAESSCTQGPVTTKRKKSESKNHNIQDRIKLEEDFSSEEEKQWVTTKEKLLKRMVKKHKNASVDDAKRAKIVSEFIEKRGDAPESRVRRRGKWRRSKKKFLEKQKQLRALSKELFGESSILSGKKYSQTYSKGRRNIRKVIDKKSLTRNTVVANMDEFERKKRLNMRQNKLREVLGCEEGVNVLVINDEVCLEYDFDELRPVVTVHPFFTKVMKAHQYEGVKFMWDACFESISKVEAGEPGGGCILAHCMGLGKTLQVLALLHTVLTHPRVAMRRVLVCCPLSTVLNWVDEINKWIGPVTNKIKVFELSKLKKTYERAYQLEDWYNGGGIFIIGYELFRSLSTLDPELDDVRPTIINKIRFALLNPGPDIIVCDEGHLLKNDSSVLAAAMSRVATKRRIVLTGTPMQNNLREYYCMVNFVKPNLLGTYPEYSNRFENPIMNGQHRDSREEDIKLMKARTHILHKVLEGCLQRQEASVLYPYLPKKHEYTVFITLTKCQLDLYKHYLQYYAKQSKQNILKDFHTLQKIWSHPQVLHNFYLKIREEKDKAVKLEDDLASEDLAASEDIKPSDTEVWWLQHLDGGGMLDLLESSHKFLVVFRILDECVALGDKVLIFSTSLYTMDTLEYFLKKINKWSLGQEYYRLDGSVPAEVRQKWCREFNAESNVKTKLFLISTRAGSLGLNMTAANRVIILDTSWNPAHDIQSIFRVYRFGQKKDCYIYRLVALGTMEQKIYERSVTKQAVACRVVDEQQIDRHYNSADLTELYRLDESGAQVAGGVAAGVRDVVLLRVARLRALHAAHEHDSLLRGSAEQGLPEHERAAAWMQFQQEHANKQMLTSEYESKAATKRPHGHDYAKSPYAENVDIKKENDVENTESASSSEPKIKGKKKETSSGIIPPNIIKKPSSKETKPQAQDELAPNIIKKITKILAKSNFQNRQSVNKVSTLITNVRNIVTSQGGNTTGDELASRIAKVLLRKEYMSMSIPVLVDIMCASINKSVSTTDSDQVEQKSKKQRDKLVPDEPKPSTSMSIDTGNSSNESEGRIRRKAALNAEKHIDIFAKESIIDLDDEDWGSEREINSISCINSSRSKNNIPQEKSELIQYKGKCTAKKKRQPVVVDITNSDSDNKKLTINKRKKCTSSDEASETRKETVSDINKNFVSEMPNDDEKIPLHPSLLTNKNFIKIVAHTYLSSNPLLDDDAATLAAQYSCFKALKEIEVTGKDIDSGPIYDIAVKVLGVTTLKKLHETGIKYTKYQEVTGSSKENIAAMHQSSAISESGKLLRDLSANKGDLEAKAASLLLSNVSKVGVKEPTSVKASASVESTQSTAATVVPVGLFKRTLTVTTTDALSLPSKDECILPDDDMGITSSPSTKPSLGSTKTPGKTMFMRRNSQPLLINSVVAKDTPKNVVEERYLTIMSSSSAPQIIVQPSVNSSNNKCTTDGPRNLENLPVTNTRTTVCLSRRASTNVQSLSNSNDTICLDSDDDDTNNISANVLIPLTDTDELSESFSISPHIPQTVANTPLENTISKVPIDSVEKMKRTTNLKQLQSDKFETPANRKYFTCDKGTSLLKKEKNTQKKTTNTKVNKFTCKPSEVLLLSKKQIKRVDNTDNSSAIVEESVEALDKISYVHPTIAQIDLDENETFPNVNTYLQSSAASTQVDDKSDSTNSKAALHNAQTKITEKLNKVPATSSDSSDKDSNSNQHDPLSVLKHVVHINADTYENEKVDNKKTTTSSIKTVKDLKKSSIDKCIKTPISDSKKPSELLQSILKSLKDKNGRTTRNRRKPLPSQTEDIIKNSNKISVTTKLENTDKNVKSTSSENTPNKTLKSKKIEVVDSKQIVNTIDLTDSLLLSKLNKNITITNTCNSKSKAATSSSNGTSKDIITIGSTKSTKTLNIGTSNIATRSTDNIKLNTITITNMQTIELDDWSNSTNKSIRKRSSTSSENSGPKKKKTERLMTLKDFNLDDIDDIIELD